MKMIRVPKVRGAGTEVTSGTTIGMMIAGLMTGVMVLKTGERIGAMTARAAGEMTDVMIIGKSAGMTGETSAETMAEKSPRPKTRVAWFRVLQLLDRRLALQSLKCNGRRHRVLLQVDLAVRISSAWRNIRRRKSRVLRPGILSSQAQLALMPRPLP